MRCRIVATGQDEVTYHFFADNDYVGVTGWPGYDPDPEPMVAGSACHQVNREISLRSLDFWRVENGLIRENWVMVDLLHLYDQIGVDVLARMREFNKARIKGTSELMRRAVQ
jgi:hypothetical protein